MSSSKSVDSKETDYKSFTKEGYHVGGDLVPQFDMQYHFKEPVKEPPFLKVKKQSWEIIINAAHVKPNHCLRLPRHIFDEGVLSPEKNILLTELDYELDVVDSYYCDVEADVGDPHKRYIVSGWCDFIKERKVEVGDRLLFTIENVPNNLYVRFIASD